MIFGNRIVIGRDVVVLRFGCVVVVVIGVVVDVKVIVVVVGVGLNSILPQIIKRIIIPKIIIMSLQSIFIIF